MVDLGDAYGVSRPLGIGLTGLAAQAVARGYHLVALPTTTARTRDAVNWTLNALTGEDFVSTGFQQGRPATLPDFEHVGPRPVSLPDQHKTQPGRPKPSPVGPNSARPALEASL